MERLSAPFVRLRRSADFEHMWAEGRRYRHHFLIFAVLPNGLSCNRYGIVVSRRVGKAVVRNRLRRQIREILRSLHDQCDIGYDVVIVARPPLVGQPFWRIRRIIEKLAVESGLLRVESDLT